MALRVLVVTSCTGQKKHSPENQLTLEDFKNNEHLSDKTMDLSAYKATAAKMYTGRQHTALMKGIEEYRKTKNDIDLAILSAGYGVLREHDEIVPYNVTFNSMNSAFIKQWSQKQRMSQQMDQLISDYDLIFFLLGDSYLKVIDWHDLHIRANQKLVFFAGHASVKNVLVQENMYAISMGTVEAKIFKAGLVWIKGELFAHLLRAVVGSSPYTWEMIWKAPAIVRDILVTSELETAQLSFFEADTDEILPFSVYIPPYHVPDDLVAKNYTNSMRFFMPENDDRVDPNYEFLTDYSNPSRNPLLTDVYAHEIYGKPQYDGILISKVNLDASKRKQEIIQEMNGIHAFMRLPVSTPIMGDCGAFSYLTEHVPPYQTDEILAYYDKFRFDVGVSIDHLIVGAIEKDKSERERRYEITLRNARDFIEKYKQHGYSFTPTGVVQGWDPTSFAEAVQEVIRMGYKHIALGGLARAKSEDIFKILKQVSPVIPDDSYHIHLFGVARSPEIMESFHKLGITSFDSASPLRRAWLGSGHNYHTVEGKHYTAIRIPEAKGTRIKKRMEQIELSLTELEVLEQNALQSLRLYDQGLKDLPPTLESIMEYDSMVGEGRDSHWEMYREVLEDKPWKTCGCTICRDIGIDVIIFRGNNRNRRRGFHNTHVYYQQLAAYHEIIEKEKEKDVK